jgi:hypothetical protein
MVRLGWIGAAMAVLGGTACDGGGEPKAAPTKIEIANPYHDRLLALSVLNRSLGLRRAIQDSSQSCQRITASAYQERYKQLELWVGRCDPEGDYAIFIGPNGEAQVRRCKDTKDLMLPACRTDQMQEVELIKTR